MTLVLNEIHLIKGLEETLLIAAADRRISKPDGSYDSTRRKLFHIPYFNGAIAYFGLAVVFPKGRRQYLSEWLPNFIKGQAGSHGINHFATNLEIELNRVVPASVLRDNASGFHICGYNDQGLPDFWYVSNIGGIRNFQYVDLDTKYAPAASHFLDRDARNVAGWDGNDPLTAKKGLHVYRNGDYRAHVAAWELLNVIFAQLLQFPDFKRPHTPHEYGEYVKFKFEIIAYLYKKWAKKNIIARPIDVLVLQNKTAHR